jgi:GDP-L-fucose synthase
VSFWDGKRVVVTGGRGFLGSYVVEQLRDRMPAAIIAPSRSEYNLLDREAVRRLLRDSRADVVIHAAAVVGGIGANQLYPGRVF